MFGVPVMDSKEEMYVYFDEAGNVQTFQVCNRIGTVPYPGCQQYLIFDNLEVKLTYRRSNLEEARQIYQKAIAFFTEARVRAEALPQPPQALIKRKAVP